MVSFASIHVVEKRVQRRLDFVPVVHRGADDYVVCFALDYVDAVANDTIHVDVVESLDQIQALDYVNVEKRTSFFVKKR
jgi:hypothetical protein